MVIKHVVEGYDNFIKFIDSFDAKGELMHILFEGSIDPVTKKSWCPDCVTVEPMIESRLSLLPENSHFIYVLVGNRSSWKSKMCPFRTDKRTKLIVIPTIIRWNTCKRLDGIQLENPHLIELIFTDGREDE